MLAGLGCLIPLAATPEVEVVSKTVHMGGMLSQVDTDVPGAVRAAAQKGRGGDVRGC